MPADETAPTESTEAEYPAVNGNHDSNGAQHDSAAEAGEEPAEAADEAAEEPDEELICRRRVVQAERIGERFRTQRVCKTRDEWNSESRRR